jgi:peptide/nickel transport system ATP-binding protein
VAVVYAGRVVEEGQIRSVFAAPRHRYTEALLRSMIDIDQDVARPLPSIPGAPPDLGLVATGCPFAPRCSYTLERCAAELPKLEGGRAHSHACFNPPSEALARDPAPAPVHATTAATAGQEPQALLEVSGLVREFPLRRGFLRRKRRTVKAVSDVSFSIRKGEILGIVGESGSGKSTLASLLVGLDQADAGSILFDGVDVTKKVPRELRRQLQLMFQDPYASLDPRMSVRRILTEPFAIQRAEPAASAAGTSSGCWERSGCPPRPRRATPTSFPAANASASGSPGRSR